jgi:hypothetical protein
MAADRAARGYRFRRNAAVAAVAVTHGRVFLTAPSLYFI